MRKKKYEMYSIDQLQNFCNKSESYRDLAKLIGYSPDGRGAYVTLKEMIAKYSLDISHFKGQGHRKNLGKHKRDISEYLNNNKKINSFELRNRLLEEGYFTYQCCSCGLSEWLNNPIPLELHHKDGNKYNNKIENLELRCPNCHYFTDNYKSKNRKKLNKDKNSDKNLNYCTNCGQLLSGTCKTNMCSKCYLLSIQNNDIPDKETLFNLCCKKSFVEIGKMYGVSDNTIRKWCEKNGLPRYSSYYKNINKLNNKEKSNAENY